MSSIGPDEIKNEALKQQLLLQQEEDQAIEEEVLNDSEKLDEDINNKPPIDSHYVPPADSDVKNPEIDPKLVRFNRHHGKQKKV